MEQTNNRITDVFFDAEGTLYIERPGMDRRDFWADPSKERALAYFRPEAAAARILRALRAAGVRVHVLSVHRDDILLHMLDSFGLLDLFDSVIVTQKRKDDAMLTFLVANKIDPSHVCMVGDLPELDILPMRRLGVRGILIDRPYNRHAAGPRAGTFDALRGLLAPWGGGWMCGAEN